MSRQFTYGKNEKLKSRKAIEQLFSNGQQFSIAPFRVCYKMINVPGLQAAAGVSSRQFKKAVDRNRIKRLTREAWRLQKNDLAALLVEKGMGMHAFLMYTGKELPDYSLISAKMQAIVKKLFKIVHETNPSNP